MSFWIGVGVLAIGLIISIGLHELGHLLPAKRFGVYVPQYFIGFGPTLWSKKRGDTEYGIKLLPLGGYVRLVGMFPPKELTPSAKKKPGTWFGAVADEARTYSASELPEGQEHRAFYALSTPKKLLVMFGGPLVNLVLSVLLLAIVISGIGTMSLTNKLGEVIPCITTQEECTAEDPITPAKEAGLLEGDRILTWGGQEVATWDEITEAIQAGGEEPTAVTVDREGETLTFNITPEVTDRPVIDDDGAPLLNENGEPVLEPAPFVGFGPSVELVPAPVSQVPNVVSEVLVGTAEIVITLPARLVSIANSVFTNAERDPNIVGLVGVGRFAGEIASVSSDQYGAKARVADMLTLLASLNMALFVFNMIPLLPLDGGHIAGALFEGGRRKLATLRGKRNPGFADTARLMPLTYVMFFVLIGMSVLLAVADIVKPVTLG